MLLQFLCSLVLLNVDSSIIKFRLRKGGGVSSTLFIDSDHLIELLLLLTLFWEELDGSNLLHDLDL
jgi:hypothetical protein